jgi:hypothetical protein
MECKMMRLLENVPKTKEKVLVKAISIDDNVEHKVVSWKGILQNAPVGYEGIFVNMNNEWMFLQGPLFN